MKQQSFGILMLVLLTAVLSCTKEQTSNNTSTATATTTAQVPQPAAMKTFHVKLSVSGAAHLVSDTTPPFVILPNFKNERPSHIAFLVALPDGVALNGLPNTRDQFDMDAIDPVTGKPAPKKLATFKWGEVPAGVEIDLEKSGVTFPAPIKIDMDDQSNDKCPAPKDQSKTPETSLHWLARLWKVSKAAGPFKLKAAFTAKDPKVTDVAVRWEIRGGQLVPEFTAERRIFAFRLGGKKALDDVTQTVSMALANTFTVDLPANDPVFVLKGRKFGTNELVELGRFKPFTGTDRIEIDLMNMPVDEFFQSHDTHTIRHFHLHYRIIDGPYKEAVPEFVDRCNPGNKPTYECGPTG